MKFRVSGLLCRVLGFALVLSGFSRGAWTDARIGSIEQDPAAGIGDVFAF